MFASGTYEADMTSGWSTGDFNGDGRTNSSDLVTALTDGGYEQGLRAAARAIPEPSTLMPLLLGFGRLSTNRKSRRSDALETD